VIFNNLLEAEPGEIERMVADFKKGGAKIVYDCDDSQDIIPDHIVNLTQAKTSIGSFYLFLREADLITTTTEILREYLQSKTKKPVVVFPNCLNPADFPQRKQYEKLRIGLAGSVTHIKDILMVIDELNTLHRQTDFEFVLFGFGKKDFNAWVKACKNTNLQYLALDLKSKVRRLNLVWVPSSKAEEYPSKLAEIGLDIGICPLEANEFNRNKSCIKFYEYAMVQTACVASDVLPYSLEPITRWKDLEKMITDKDFREAERKKQQEWVFKNRDVTKKVELWEKAYQKLIL